MPTRYKLEDADLRSQILQKIRFGVPPAIAAQAHGVKERTYYDFMALGRDPKNRAAAAVVAREFVDSVTEARGYALSRAQLTHTQLALGLTLKREVRRVVLTDEGAHEEIIEREFHPPDARAIQWWLERRAPEFYGAVAAKDADSADPDEVMQPGSADEDPVAVAAELAGLLDRYVAAAPAGEGDPGGLPEARSD